MRFLGIAPSSRLPLSRKDRESRMMIEDWEIGAFYWNCLKYAINKAAAVGKVKGSCILRERNCHWLDDSPTLLISPS